MALKMEGLRRLYGAAEPIRRGMEVMMCAVGFAPPYRSLESCGTAGGSLGEGELLG